MNLPRDLDPDYGARSRLGFILESVLIAALALLVVAIFVVAIVRAQPVTSADVRVIDGDTIAVQGLRERIRLVGFNAPGTRNLACSAELQLDDRANRRLLELVRQGPERLAPGRVLMPGRHRRNRVQAMGADAACSPLRARTWGPGPSAKAWRFRSKAKGRVVHQRRGRGRVRSARPY